MDNTGALSTALWGRAGIALPEQQRIMRRLAHRLRWQGGALQLHYVPSSLNPANPISCWFSGQSAKEIVVQARAREAVFLSCARTAPWGSIADKDRQQSILCGSYGW